jgi:hypothetical protein
VSHCRHPNPSQALPLILTQVPINVRGEALQLPLYVGMSVSDEVAKFGAQHQVHDTDMPALLQVSGTVEFGVCSVNGSVNDLYMYRCAVVCFDCTSLVTTRRRSEGSTLMRWRHTWCGEEGGGGESERWVGWWRPT